MTRKNSIANFDKGNISASIVYYAVFCTYRKRKVFCTKGLVCRITELVNMYLKEMECELLEMAVYDNHVVLSVSANASLSPISIFSSIRRQSSSVLRKEYEYLNKSSALWGRGLLISTEAIKSEDYLAFLRKQGRKDVRRYSDEDSEPCGH